MSGDTGDGSGDAEGAGSGTDGRAWRGRTDDRGGPRGGEQPRAVRFDAVGARAWVRAACAAVADGQARLTELDRAVGDGDHGVNLCRGMRAAVSAVDRLWPAAAAGHRPGRGTSGSVPGGGPAGDPVGVGTAGAGLVGVDTVLVTFGNRLLDHVGGASGPLYGTALRTAGKALTGRIPDGVAVSADRAAGADATAVGEAFQAGLGALCRLGTVRPGEKTMVDAFGPAVDAWCASARSGQGLPAAAARAARAAAAGARSTVPLRARHGHALYLGDRTVGWMDPGAASTAMLFRALAEVLHQPSNTRPDVTGPDVTGWDRTGP